VFSLSKTRPWKGSLIGDGKGLEAVLSVVEGESLNGGSLFSMLIATWQMANDNFHVV
jgi:hypothetical protein